LIVCLAVFACYSIIIGQEGGTGGGGVNIELIAENIVGNVIYQDGVTPVADLPVRIWSKDKQKMVFRTRTDKSGVFKLPRQSQGESYIFVGQVKIDMKILSQGGNMLVQNHDLVVVLSRPFTIDMTPRMSDMTVGSVAMSAPSVISNPNDNKDTVIDGNAGRGNDNPRPGSPDPDILIVTNIVDIPVPPPVVSP